MKKKIFLLLISAVIIVFLGISGIFAYNTLSKPKAPENGYIHLSFDDTIDVFRDLTQNKDTYDSIFDNEFLGFCKEMHDKYGAVFSFYCFYEKDDFSLANCTNKFAGEFGDNSDWMKFGFHNMSEEGNLANSSNAEAAQFYTTVTNQLLRITGDSNCIDSIIRLQNFAGSSDAINGLSSSSNGITGLLTADDNRVSYYLDADKNIYIADNDELYDEERNLYLISTDLRLENSISPYTDLINISKDDKQNTIIEVFTHEWKFGTIMKSKIKSVCKFADKAGYKWMFPMENYK